VNGTTYPTDKWTNVTPTILSKVGRNLHLNPQHPIGILSSLIQSHFDSFQHLDSLSPIVTVQQNFDDLGFPADHPGRNLTDSYYLNETTMLRTHTSAHEVEMFRKGLDRFLLTADVYRRDEIDRSHYPVFHQMEGCNVVSGVDGLARLERENVEMRRTLDSANIVITDPTRDITVTNPIQAEHGEDEARIISEHLKNSLNSLVLRLFGGLRKEGDQEPLQVRWIEATFPWTAPSYEVEVLYDGKWLEILGCGVVRQDTLNRSGPCPSHFSSSSLINPASHRRPREARLGIRTRTRAHRHGALLRARHPTLLVTRRAVPLPILAREYHPVQTVLALPGMLQGFQLLDERGIRLPRERLL
jgi:phenylalanyl-tRNA synthetase alpha chain